MIPWALNQGLQAMWRGQPDERLRRARLARRQQRQVEAIKERLRLVAWLKFQVEGEVEWLPFPGLSRVVKRPPPEFLFVGRSEYAALLDKILDVEEGSRGVVITGPKGSGKSCLLRALAAEFIARSRDCPRERIICIWHFDARQELHSQVQELLMFAFSDADQDVIDEIFDISSPDHLASFLSRRKADGEGDKITLLSDGQEKYDPAAPSPEEMARRAEAGQWLVTFERFADLLVKALSPEAADVLDIPARMERYELRDAAFGQVEYTSFLDDTVLGRMLKEHPEREADVNLYAGRHPMSLFYLDKACGEHVHSIARTFRSKKRPLGGMERLDPNTGNKVVKWEGGLEAPERYLDEKEDWERVLTDFKRAEPFESIRNYIKNMYTGDVEKLRDPASVLKGYVRNGCFCTNYLQAVHLEAALERLKANVYRSPEFKAKLTPKLRKSTVIWPEVGWACEGFVAEAIQALGLKFEGKQIEVFKLEALKGEPVKIKPSQWLAHQTRYMLPGTYSFKYVDGVLAWVDEQGMLHIVALQVTVSPETHRRTEYKFVMQEEVQRWYAGHCVVHYVYLCPTPTKPTEGHPAQNGRVAYTVHELALSQCFTNLGQDELDILKRLGELRSAEVARRKRERLSYQRSYQGQLKTLPQVKKELLKKAKKQPGSARAWLEEECRTKYGIQDPSRKQYPNVYSLLEAMNV